MSARDERADTIIWTAATGAAIAGALNPTPLVGDVAILITAWVTMLGGMAKLYGAKFDVESFLVAAKQALKSAGLYLAGTFIFIGIVKFTGAGTVPAAVANALLNFGFTASVGLMYKNAWRVNSDPSVEDLEALLREVAEEVVHHLKGEQRRTIMRMYKESRRNGSSRREAIERVINYVFGDRFKGPPKPGGSSS